MTASSLRKECRMEGDSLPCRGGSSRFALAEGFSKIAYRLRERVAIEHRREKLQVELRNEPAALRPREFTFGEDVDLDDTLAPVPHLLDTESLVDRQLVDAAVRPFDLDGEVRAVPLLRAEDIGLIGLGSSLLLLLFERPTPDRVDFDSSIDTPRHEQMSDV